MSVHLADCLKFEPFCTGVVYREDSAQFVSPLLKYKTSINTDSTYLCKGKFWQEFAGIILFYGVSNGFPSDRHEITINHKFDLHIAEEH